MRKRGLSSAVTTVLLVLIAIAAVLLLWGIVNSFFKIADKSLKDDLKKDIGDDGNANVNKQPIVSILYPGELYIADDIPITVYASDPDGGIKSVKLSINIEGIGETIKTEENSPETYVFILQYIPEGPHKLTATATDDKGLSSIDTRDITILSPLNSDTGDSGDDEGNNGGTGGTGGTGGDSGGDGGDDGNEDPGTDSETPDFRVVLGLNAHPQNTDYTTEDSILLGVEANHLVAVKDAADLFTIPMIIDDIKEVKLFSNDIEESCDFVGNPWIPTGAHYDCQKTFSSPGQYELYVKVTDKGNRVKESDKRIITVVSS